MFSFLFDFVSQHTLQAGDLKAVNFLGQALCSTMRRAYHDSDTGCLVMVSCAMYVKSSIALTKVGW